jgi:hypothetical protein
MKKITETLWLDEELGLAVVQPEDRTDWIVLNKQFALVFGPNNFGNCLQYIEKKKKDVA